jgi:hypothetical protein
VSKCFIKSTNGTWPGVDDVVDGGLLHVSHVAEDGEDEHAGDEASAGVDQACDQGVSARR